MRALLVTPRNKESGIFLKKLLSKLNDVKSIEVIDKDEKEIPFAVLSESSLEKEWNSKEDNIWDTWASEKLKKDKK